MTASTGLLLRLLRLGLVAGSLGDGLSVLLVLVDGPVEDVVVLEPFTHKEVPEDLAQVRVVRLVVESKGTRVVEIDGELVGKSAAEHFGGSRHLLFHDPVVLLFLRGSLQSLPREGTAAEVEHDVSEGLHVITAGLFCKNVRG